MQDKISSAIENNEYVMGFFFDLAKAFDTGDHNILLKTLDVYGIQVIQLDWFASYLDNRLQCVCCNRVFSKPRSY